MKFLVTGGAGFIGSALIRYLIEETEHSVVNVDKLTYAGNLNSLLSISDNPRYRFEKIDICEKEKIENLIFDYKPDVIMHLAAESHVDRSIDGPDVFINTNIIGTYQLLQASLKYWKEFKKSTEEHFIFHHISTDEVFGDLEHPEDFFTEETPYSPSSPYSATKAASDHLVRAWYRTYGLPTIVTNCSNNYGPFHFPEKLIPLTILSAIKGNKIPIYGTGEQIRDWLFVEDHAKALYMVVKYGTIGSTYNIGGHNEKTNIEVVETICNILEDLGIDKPNNIKNFKDLITFVDERPGHDKRYAIDASKMKNEIGWEPEENFSSGIKKTVLWYLNNPTWWQDILNEKYNLQRLGLD